jgi:hypothetical protein
MDMETRADVLKFISGHIIHGRNVRIQLDGEELRLQFSGIHHIWHNQEDASVIAIVNVETFTVEMSNEWAKQPVQFYDL